jgi:hypothetical protein
MLVKRLSFRTWDRETWICILWGRTDVPVNDHHGASVRSSMIRFRKFRQMSLPLTRATLLTNLCWGIVLGNHATIATLTCWQDPGK